MRKAFLISLAVATPVLADIVPSWRVNPTGPGPLDNPLADAFSVSLMVTLSGDSKFNVAGLRIDQQTFGGRAFTIYNVPAAQSGSDNNAPNPAFFAIFPVVEFDTYVTTTDGYLGPGAAIAGGYVQSTGPAVFGANHFDVAWGATPNTGSPGTFEIARITFRELGTFTQRSVPVLGEVRSSDAPNVAVPLPPMPVPSVPERVMLAPAMIALCIARRRRIL